MFKNISSDLPASIVVFFVALPLCLGIALASGAPLISGVISGIVGGIVVGLASGSQLGVSGPAAGLAVIVASAIATLGSFSAFLYSVVIAGILQYMMGHFKAGFIAYFFPSSVIKGMLSGIGLLIILKQIPHAVGFDADYFGNESFNILTGGNALDIIAKASEAINPGAATLAGISLILLVLWDKVLAPSHKIFKLIQGPIAVVLLSMGFYVLTTKGILPFSFEPTQIVALPDTTIPELVSSLTYPDFSSWNNPLVYQIAIVMALIASIETLLCVEATDKLDPFRRVTPTNKELKAQGLGNLVSGLIGGLPVTQVIVRSSANISFGAQSKLSAVLHGVWLLIAALFLASFLNLIPLAALASVLIIVGYKLAKPQLFKSMFKLGLDQFIPFVATIAAIVYFDLLKGIGIGLVVSLFFTLKQSYLNTFHFTRFTDPSENNEPAKLHLVLADEVTFFNKANITKELEELPQNSAVIIDCSRCKFLDHDVKEYLSEFILHAPLKGISVQTINFEPINITPH